MQVKAGYCDICDTNRKYARASTNHWLHFGMMIIMTFFFSIVGFVIWGTVWAMNSVRIGGWQCVECGNNKYDRPWVTVKEEAPKPPIKRPAKLKAVN